MNDPGMESVLRLAAMMTALAMSSACQVRTALFEPKLRSLIAAIPTWGGIAAALWVLESS